MNLILFKWLDRDGHSLIDGLARRYGMNGDDLLAAADIYLLDSVGFEEKVRALGYGGPIYFRGITGPNPSEPGKLWILLNDDLMRTQTSFDRELLSLLEYAGIASHELSHVAQELLGRALGVSVDVDNAEEALLIEGQAEYENEQAWMEFAPLAMAPTPFALFAHEQGVEVVFREGNEQSGNLFPYTVGLPFAAATAEAWESKGLASVDRVRETMRILGDETTLEAWLFKTFMVGKAL